MSLIPGLNNLGKSPKGKLPYITDGNSTIADTFFILEYLQKKYDSPLDKHLSEEELALSGLLEKSLDENFYWCVVHSRWINDDSWPIIKSTFFSKMPFPLKKIAPLVARRGVKSALFKHGMGRHSDEEILQIANKTLSDLSTLLSDKIYFFGKSPSTFDAVAFAFLAEVILARLDNSLNQMAREYSNLVSFCNRINENHYAQLNLR